MDDLNKSIREIAESDIVDAIHGAIGALADVQGKMITILLRDGVLTSLSAQQMINELHNAKYQQPPLHAAERLRRETVKLIASHLQEKVEWDRASDQSE